jgi:hypothetical protein
MKPVKTSACNMVYKGPTEEIGDLHCERVRPGRIRSFWKPSEAELELLNEGGTVELELLTEPIPPVAVNVETAEASAAVGDHPFKEGTDEAWPAADDPGESLAGGDQEVST